MLALPRWCDQYVVCVEWLVLRHKQQNTRHGNVVLRGPTGASTTCPGRTLMPVEVSLPPALITSLRRTSMRTWSAGLRGKGHRVAELASVHSRDERVGGGMRCRIRVLGRQSPSNTIPNLLTAFPQMWGSTH